jgi:ubiquinone/menaquinone biosynthesis C-methylase UbiE
MIYEGGKMSLLKEQYSDSKNFMARVELGRRFRTNPYSWLLWVFDQIQFPQDARVLEIGCGNAILWKANINRIPEDAHVLLSDFSQGMLDDARKVLGDAELRFNYEVMDAQEILYPDNSFDVVIANLMLYHIPDRKKAISEISRVLKRGGTFYATTFGINDMKELRDIISNYDGEIYYSAEPFACAFGLENGEEQLRKSFDQVQLVNYENSLEITDVGPVVDYVRSFGKVNQNLKGHNLKDFENYLEEILKKDGKIKVTKDTGIFIATKPK